MPHTAHIVFRLAHIVLRGVMALHAAHIAVPCAHIVRAMHMAHVVHMPAAACLKSGYDLIEAEALFALLLVFKRAPAVFHRGFEALVKICASRVDKLAVAASVVDVNFSVLQPAKFIVFHHKFHQAADVVEVVVFAVHAYVDGEAVVADRHLAVFAHVSVVVDIAVILPVAAA